MSFACDASEVLMRLERFLNVLNVWRRIKGAAREHEKQLMKIKRRFKYTFRNNEQNTQGQLHENSRKFLEMGGHTLPYFPLCNPRFDFNFPVNKKNILIVCTEKPVGIVFAVLSHTGF